MTRKKKGNPTQWTWCGHIYVRKFRLFAGTENGLGWRFYDENWYRN
jgi:hypothetical protein